MPYFVYHTLEKKYVRSVSWGNLYGTAGSPKPTLSRGGPLSASDIERLSTTLILGQPIGRRAAFADVLGHSPFVVSRKVIDLIETLQPGPYDYIPVALENEERNKAYGTYYALHLPVHLDCIDYERTEWGRGSGAQGAAESGFLPRGNTPFALKGFVIRRHHIWRAAEPAERRCFVSDELHDLLVAHNVHGWKYRQCRIV